MIPSAAASGQIETVRAFNRFYTRQLGLLEAGLLNSPFSLTEGRILYELAHGEGLSAAALARELRRDPGYLSRLVNRLARAGMVGRTRSASDRRRSILTLTPAGKAAFGRLDQASRDQVAGMLANLDGGERNRLVAAMAAVRRLLGDRPAEPVTYVLRPLRSGDIGWITHRQGLLYASEYGWNEEFEALAARILADFVTGFDPRREAAWIAERDGEVVGSVFVVRQTDEVAKLRLLYVEPSARGLGIGRRLVAECVAFARARGYRTLTLWTNDVLTSARRIYEAAGFRLVGEDRHHSFGKDLVGQNWERALA